MSVEPLLIAALVESGNPKRALREGITVEDFFEYNEEFEWLIYQQEQRREITTRTFLKSFGNFAWIVPEETIPHLCNELKRENAFAEAQELMKELSEDLDSDNVFQQLERVRDRFGAITRNDTAQSNIYLTRDWRSYIKEIREIGRLRDLGILPGFATGIPHLDHHLGGLMKGNMGDVQGRPGEGKSSIIGYMAAECKLQGLRVGFFSPEMNEKQHRDRMNTIYSAKKPIQEALGLKGAFRNRALREGDVNPKRLAEFCEYMESLAGEVILFTNKTRKGKITPAYIEAMIDEEALDVIIVDPIGKLRSPRRRESPYMETSDCVDAIEDICKVHNIPTVITNQAHRQNSSKSRAPTKDQSFGTDMPIQESDWVLNIKHFTEDRQLELRCDKNRHGAPFTALYRFQPNVGLLSSVTEIRHDYYNGYHEDESEEATREEVSHGRRRRRAHSSNGDGGRKPVPERA